MALKTHDLIVVLINWFHAERTVSCIRRFGNWRTLRPGLIVVCNGDTVEGRAKLREACGKDVMLIEMPENTGFSGANNTGIRRALELGAKRISLFNTDAEIAEPNFARLLEAFDNVDGLAAVGPLIVEQRDGGEVVFAGGRDISRWRQTRIPFHRDAVEAAGTRYRQPDYVMGTAMVSDRTAWEQAGLLDERYFFSGEVADWCERVRALGFQLAVDTTARALHHSNLAGSTAREGDYLYYSLRNRFLFAARHRSGQRFRFVMRWTAIGLGEAAKAMVRGKWVRAGACLSALRDGLAGRFGRRRPEQERRA